MTVVIMQLCTRIYVLKGSAVGGGMHENFILATTWNSKSKSTYVNVNAIEATPTPTLDVEVETKPSSQSTVHISFAFCQLKDYGSTVV